MPHHSHHTRRSTIGPAPVRSSVQAVRVLQRFMPDEPRPCTFAFFLDVRGVGGLILDFDGTCEPDAVLDIVECMAFAADNLTFVDSVVVATMRPDGGVLPGDVDRWLEASALCEQRGIELREWYVVGPDGFLCPRDLLGEPDRWPE